MKNNSTFYSAPEWRKFNFNQTALRNSRKKRFTSRHCQFSLQTYQFFSEKSLAEIDFLVEFSSHLVRGLTSRETNLISVQSNAKKSIKSNQLHHDRRGSIKRVSPFLLNFIFIRFEMLKVTKLPSTNVIKYIYGSLKYKNIFNLYTEITFIASLSYCLSIRYSNPFTLLLFIVKFCVLGTFFV
jgi:hypothetical protein